MTISTLTLNRFEVQLGAMISEIGLPIDSHRQTDNESEFHYYIRMAFLRVKGELKDRAEAEQAKPQEHANGQTR